MSKLYSNLLKLAQRVDPYTKAGKQIKNYDSAVAISAVTAGGGTTYTVDTSTAHGLATGDKVSILEVTVSVAMPGLVNTATARTHTVTVTDANTFTVAVSGAAGTYASGGKVIPFPVCAVDGDKFTGQRLLDIYNEARWALANGIMKYQGPYERATTLSGLVTRNGAIASHASGVFTKPSGYLEIIGDIWNSTDSVRIPVVPVQAEDHLRALEGTYNPYVVETASTFIAPTGNTYIDDADVCVWSYYACTDWPIADTFIPYTGTTYREENLPTELEPLLIDVAVAIANQQGEQAIQSIIAASLGGKK